MNKKVLFGFMRFSDFLSESLKPKPINFGTDLTNKEWKVLDHNFNVTFFESHNKIYTVLFRNGHVGFGLQTNQEIQLQDINTWNDLNKAFSFANKKGSYVREAMAIYNEVIYVLIDFVTKNKPEEIYFNGSTSELKEFYQFIAKNRDFNNIIKELGYEYKGFESGHGQDEPVYVYRLINNG